MNQNTPDGYQEFPKMLYLNGDATKQKIVNSAAEEEDLGEKWIDAPIDPAELDAPGMVPTPAA